MLWLLGNGSERTTKLLLESSQPSSSASAVHIQLALRLYLDRHEHAHIYVGFPPSPPLALCRPVYVIRTWSMFAFVSCSTIPPPPSLQTR